MANHYGNTRKYADRTTHEQRSEWAKKAAETRNSRYTADERSEWARRAAISRRENGRPLSKEEYASIRAEIKYQKVVAIILMCGFLPCFLFIFGCMINVLVGLL